MNPHIVYLSSFRQASHGPTSRRPASAAFCSYQITLHAQGYRDECHTRGRPSLESRSTDEDRRELVKHEEARADNLASPQKLAQSSREGRVPSKDSQTTLQTARRRDKSKLDTIMVEGSDLSSDELEYLDGPVELAPVESPARSSIPYFPGYLHSRANAQGQSGTDSTRSARPTTSRLPTPSRPTELSHAELPSSHLPLKRSVPLSERLPRGSVPPGQSPHDSTRSGPGGASTNRKTLLSSFISADKHLKETPRVLGSSLWPRPNRVSETNPPTAFGEEQLPQSSSSKDRLVSLVSAEGSGTEEDDEEADEMPSLESRRKRARALSLRRHVRDRRVGSDHDAPNPQDAQASRGKALRTSKRQRVAKGHVRPSSYGRDESTEDEEFSPLPVFKSIKAESALQVGTNRKSPRASRKSINWSDSDGRLDDDDDDGSNESDSQPISTKKLVEMLPKRRSRSKSFPSSRKDVLSEISAEETDHELLRYVAQGIAKLTLPAS